MSDPYSQALAIGAPFANLGKQMFQGRAMYEKGRMTAEQEAAKTAAFGAHANLYGAQAQKAQEEAAGLAQRRQYQTPEFATKLAANLAGLSEGQGAELSGYQQRGNWGMNPGADLPAGQEGPPMPEMPKSAPSWYNPQIEQRVNQARGVALGNLAATGNGKIDDMTKAFVQLLERGDMDRAMADGNNGLNAYQAALKGKMYDSTPRGILNQDGGKEAVNADWQKVQRAAAAENYAQANNANASASQHIASRDLTRSKIGQPTVNPDGSVTPAGSSIPWKYDAGSDEYVAPPTPEFPNGRRSGNIAKNNAAKSLEFVISQFGHDIEGNPVVDGKTKSVLDATPQGGIMGISGYIGKVTDSQDAKRFENLKEQLSTELRTLFRIPGEGALSDKEQAQYGVQLPNVTNDKKTNAAILNDIKARVKLRQDNSANPLSGQPPTSPQQPNKPPKIQRGQVVDGYRFKGGNPADPASWEKM